MLKKILAMITALTLSAGTVTVYAETVSAPPVEDVLDDIINFIIVNDLDVRVIPFEEGGYTDDAAEIHVQGYDELSLAKISDYALDKGYTDENGVSIVKSYLYETEEEDGSEKLASLPDIDGLEVVHSLGNYTWNDQCSNNENIAKELGKDDVFVYANLEPVPWFSYSAASIMKLNNDEYINKLKNWYRNFKPTADDLKNNDAGPILEVYCYYHGGVWFYDDDGELVRLGVGLTTTENYGTIPTIYLEKEFTGENGGEYKYEITGPDCPIWELLEGSEKYLKQLDDSTEWDFSVGDVNNDNTVNVTDLSMLAAHVKSVKALEGEQLRRADTVLDNKLNVSDIQKLAYTIKGVQTDSLKDTEAIAMMIRQFARKNGIALTCDEHNYDQELKHDFVEVHYIDDAEEQINEFLRKKNIDLEYVRFSQEDTAPEFSKVLSYADGTLDDVDLEHWFELYGDREHAYALSSAALPLNYYSAGTLCKIDNKAPLDKLRSWYENAEFPAESDSDRFIINPGSSDEKLFFYDKDGKLVQIDIKHGIKDEAEVTLITVNSKTYDAADLKDCPAAEISRAAAEYISGLGMAEQKLGNEFSVLMSYVDGTLNGIDVESWVKDNSSKNAAYALTVSAVAPDCYRAGVFCKLNDENKIKKLSEWYRDVKLPAEVDKETIEYLDGGITDSVFFFDNEGNLVTMTTESCFINGKHGTIITINDKIYNASDLADCPVFDINKDIYDLVEDLDRDPENMIPDPGSVS